MLRPEYDPSETNSPRVQHIALDGIRYRLTQWHHLQALATTIEAPTGTGWAVGHIGNVRYAAWYGGAL